MERKAILAVLALLALSAASVSGEDCICPMLYDPVCADIAGINGAVTRMTFSNKCAAECKKALKVVPGECPAPEPACSRPCPLDHHCVAVTPEMCNKGDPSIQFRPRPHPTGMPFPPGPSDAPPMPFPSGGSGMPPPPLQKRDMDVPQPSSLPNHHRHHSSGMPQVPFECPKHFCQPDGCATFAPCSIEPCGQGEVSLVPEGGCCPVCSPAPKHGCDREESPCRANENCVRLEMSECKGKAPWDCFSCAPKNACANVECGLPPICQQGKLLKLSDECCPKCVDCYECEIPVCTREEILVNMPGQCCPICAPKRPSECIGVMCMVNSVPCPAGTLHRIPEGKCCAECVSIEGSDSVNNNDPSQFQDCSGGRAFTECGSACEPSCAFSPTVCVAMCVARCQCPGGLVRHKGLCIAKQQCPATTGDGADSVGKCSFNGATYKNGQSFRADCNTCTCRDGAVMCTKMMCPPKKKLCDANKKCPDNMVCTSEVMPCFVAPCPTQNVCVSPLDTPTATPTFFGELLALCKEGFTCAVVRAHVSGSVPAGTTASAMCNALTARLASLFNGVLDRMVDIDCAMSAEDALVINVRNVQPGGTFAKEVAAKLVRMLNRSEAKNRDAILGGISGASMSIPFGSETSGGDGGWINGIEDDDHDDDDSQHSGKHRSNNSNSNNSKMIAAIAVGSTVGAIVVASAVIFVVRYVRARNGSRAPKVAALIFGTNGYARVESDTAPPAYEGIKFESFSNDKDAKNQNNYEESQA